MPNSKNLNPLFSTVLPKQFIIPVDYSNGCKITVTPELEFSNEWNSHDGLNYCLIQWANHEFKNNTLAQAKLEKIKKADRASLGSCSIADYGNWHVIAVGLSHVILLLESMGYKVIYTKDEQSKLINQLTLTLKSSPA